MSFAIICESACILRMSGSAIQWNTLSANGVSAAKITMSPSSIFIARERASSAPSSSLRVTMRVFGSIEKSLTRRMAAAGTWPRILVEARRQ